MAGSSERTTCGDAANNRVCGWAFWVQPKYKASHFIYISIVSLGAVN